MRDEAVRSLELHWPSWVQRGQKEPEGEWRVWVMLAGRGFGKTRTGAEWLCARAAAARVRIALVAATPDEARRVMVEGRSGLLAVAAEALSWEPSIGRVRWKNGSEAFVYSGSNAEGLRGPEHHLAWCDELAKWRQAEEACRNLMLGLRLGAAPQALVTTTPKPVRALKQLLAGEGTERSNGRMRDNIFLPPAFVEAMERELEGTRIGRQELDGELLEEVEEPLWKRDLLETARSGTSSREYRRIVVGVDPPAGVGGDACGIVACGLGQDGIGYVLGDHSAGGLSPEGWARKAAAAAEAHGAAHIVAEANNGGKMVESVLKGAGITLPVRLVHASEGKAARAAPVATLFEAGRAKLAGRFPELEDELCGLSWDGSYQGPGRSPDRADAMVWAMTELMLKAQPIEPRILSF